MRREQLRIAIMTWIGLPPAPPTGSPRPLTPVEFEVIINTTVGLAASPQPDAPIREAVPCVSARLPRDSARRCGSALVRGPRHNGRMIESKADYREYLRADRAALNVTGSARDWLLNDIWAYQRALRRVEYCMNVRTNPIARLYSRWIFRRRGRRMGFSISPNVFGPGLSIAHHGTITVNGGARVGSNCRIHPSTSIGTARGYHAAAPSIGDNVYIAPGARIFGPIVLGHDVTIGANAVVHRSWKGDGITLVGIPAQPTRSSAARTVARDGGTPSRP